MILTKDNLLRFLTEKKYLTPTDVAEQFETTTMIASAALSEIVKDKKAQITNLKHGSTPYYFDPRQKDALIELGEKHFSKYEKDTFLKLKEQQVLNDAALSIQERLAIERIKDFAIPIESDYQGRTLKFWVWYLRDLNETKKQIYDALNPKNSPTPQQPKPQQQSNVVQRQLDRKQQFQKSLESSLPSQLRESSSQRNYVEEDEDDVGVFRPKPKLQPKSSDSNKEEAFIENYLKENYLKIEEKDKEDKGIYYKASIKINKIHATFDCFFFIKKPKDEDIIRFYSKNTSPKIIFIINAPKKFFKLAEKLDNLTIVNI